MRRISAIAFVGAILGSVVILAFSFIPRRAASPTVTGQTGGVLVEHNWTDCRDIWSLDDYPRYGLIQYGDDLSVFRCQTSVLVGPIHFLVPLPASAIVLVVVTF